MRNKQENYFDFERLEMLEFLPKEIGKSIEFGCSNGHFSKFVKDNYNCESWGVDFDEIAIEVAKTKLDKVICGDALEAIEQLPDSYFDCLICNDLIEHLPDPLMFLRNVSRKMKSGASLVCSIPNVRYWKNTWDFLIKKDWKYEDAGILDYTHNKFFTFKSISRLLSDAELSNIQVTGINRTKSLKFLIPNLILLKTHDDMGYYQIAVVATFH